jgi:hypothetical protein
VGLGDLSVHNEATSPRVVRLDRATPPGGRLGSRQFCEGFKRQSRPDKVRFYSISQGSLEECRYYLRLAQDLGFGDVSEL